MARLMTYIEKKTEKEKQKPYMSSIILLNHLYSNDDTFLVKHWGNPIFKNLETCYVTFLENHVRPIVQKLKKKTV